MDSCLKHKIFILRKILKRNSWKNTRKNNISTIPFSVDDLNTLSTNDIQEVHVHIRQVGSDFQKYADEGK
jgi:hypothetical protein